MTSVTTGVTVDDLQAFADAWNRHDVDALMTFMADDCAFEASAGPDACGERHAGREAVRARTRSAKHQMKRIMEAARQRGTEAADRMHTAYQHLLAIARSDKHH